MIRTKLFLAAALAMLYFTGCGVWTDFTTYFNTYYNAKTLFERVEEQILLKQKDPFAFREEKIDNQTSQELTKVIEKCSKIFQYQKESSYFDDALFITGKAFYYQQEYSRAQRKFLELLGIPESDYYLPNKFWLAKTYLQLREFDEGLKLIEELKQEALAEGEEELFVEASMFKMSFLVSREDYSSAIEEGKKLIESYDDDETRSLTWYQIGRIYLLQDDKEEALQAFASVLKYTPAFDIEFESRLEYARILKELGKVEESENVLFELRDEGKFIDQMDRILIEVGQVYFDKNENDKALNIFKEVDSLYKQKPTSGIASMWLGEIYEFRYGDYDSAYKYFGKTVSSMAPQEIKMKAAQRNRNIEKYRTVKAQIEEQLLQKLYITNPDRFIRDSIDYDIAYNEFIEENRKRQEQMNQSNQLIQNQEEIARQQQLLQKQDQARQGLKKGEAIPLIVLIAQGKAKRPSKPRISVDSLNALLAQNYYNLGNLFFSELEVPDSAFYYYKHILENYPNKNTDPQVKFALATYYETINEKEKADGLYREIYYNYPKHPLYNEAGKKLGLIKEEAKKAIVKTTDPAEPLYITAEELYYDKKMREAIRAFRKVYLEHPRSSFAPKSIYYIGLIHEELAEYDSAAFYYGILSSKEYAQTPLGRAVFAKYTEYKNEKERLEKEKQAKQEAEKKLIEEKNKPAETPAGKTEAVEKQLIEKPGTQKSKADSLETEFEGKNRKLKNIKPVAPDSSKQKPD